MGFDRATIRGIAADAGVDPALVIHYFGTKVGLFTAAMQVPDALPRAVETLQGTDRDQLGEAILRTVLGLWSDPDTLDAWLGLLRSAMSDDRAAAMLREFMTAAVLSRLEALLGVDDAGYRMELVASQIVGLGIVRHVLRVEPLASASDDELVATVGPTLQRYLTG